MATVVESRPVNSISSSALPGRCGETVTVNLFKGSCTQSNELNFKASEISFQAPEVQDFLKQDASGQLSELLGYKATNGDIFMLFLELMKLEIDSQQREKVALNDERRLQLQYLDKEVDNYKSQARWMLFSHLGAGVLGIGSGLAPIVGHTHGKGILDALSTFDRFKGLKVRDSFQNLATILDSMKKMQEATGQVYSTKAEGDRKRWESFSGIHRTDHELKSEKVRSLGERFKSCEQFLSEVLRMQHDVAMQR